MKKYSNIAVAVGLALIVFSLVNYSINNVWDWMSWLLLIPGILMTTAGLYLYFQFREKKLSKKSMQYGAVSGFSTILVIGILVILAFITSRHTFRADLTENSLFSLAEQTKSILNNLDKKVKVYAFFEDNDQVSVKDLLNEYKLRTKNLEYEFIDPNEKPQVARRFQVKEFRTVVVECGNKRETITDLSESTLTNAIIKVTRDLDKTIYFTTGHGEKSIEDDAPRGYKKTAENIRNENYVVKSLNIAQQHVIPEDCSVLIIAGPTADFFQFELDSIKNYLANGGDLFVMLDPQWKPALVNFLKEYNVNVGDNIVVENSTFGKLFGTGPEVPLVQQYEKHDIFKNFNVMSFYPVACSVEPGKDGTAGYTAKTLFKSSSNSWGEVNYQNTQVSPDPEDLKGPVSLAVMSNKTISAKIKNQIFW